MKIALCYYGLLRSFKEVCQTHIDNIVNPYKKDIDIFMYCPNMLFPKTDIDPYHTREDNEEDINSDFIKNIFGENLKSLVLYNYDWKKFDNKVLEDKIPLINNCESPSWRGYSMFYAIQNSMLLKSKYEKKLNINYDAVIMIRPDIEITTQMNLDSVNLDKISFNNSHLGPVIGFDKFFNDHMFISTSKNMDLMLNLYNSVPNDINNDGVIVNNETLIAYQFLKQNLEFEVNNFFSHIVIR